MPNYISAIKLPNGDIYQIKDSNALKLTGGQVTGPVNFGDSVYINDLNIGNLITTGNAAFANNIQVNTINGVEVGLDPKFTDTIYVNKDAVQNGTELSLVTTGQKYIWSSKTSNSGTVTSVAAVGTEGILISGSPITASGTFTISLADNYGDIKNPYQSKTKNYVLAAPSTGNGVPTFRALVSADLPAGTSSMAGVVKLGATGGAAAYGHAHGSLTSAGIITTTAAIENGDKLVITDSNDSNKIKGSSITFGASESSFLTNKGTWTEITKASIGLSDVENTKLSTWAGTSNIITVGSITTGVWGGSTILVSHGGTGTTSFEANSLIASGANSTAALVTRGISTSITTSASSNIPTESAVKTYVDNQIAAIQGTVQGGYVTIAGNAQQVTGRKTFSNLAGASFKPAESSTSCDISYNQSLGALVFSFTN